MWLLQDEVLEAMRDARSLANHEPTLEERREYAAALRDAYARPEASLPRNVKIAGTTAQINITGVLTEEPDCFAMMFGGGNTSYRSIREGLAAAAADPAVKDVVFSMSSPGGNVDGLFETLAAIDTFPKPIRTVASIAASAAYAMAAKTDSIEAVSEASVFGSIGVATSLRKDPSVVDIASTEAPNKRPDVGTPEGVAVVRKQLDDVHNLFVTHIAAGRTAATGETIDASQVNSDFGRGSTFLAAEARKLKMIDKAPKAAKRIRPGKYASAGDGGAESVAEEDIKTMTKDQLKAAHPEVYAAILEEGRVAGVAEGVKTGSASELKRVKAHLKMADSTGAHKVAREAIESGASLADEEVMAGYMSAAANRRDQAVRQTETEEASASTNVTPKAEVVEEEDLVDRAVAALQAGKKKK